MHTVRLLHACITYMAEKSLSLTRSAIEYFQARIPPAVLRGPPSYRPIEPRPSVNITQPVGLVI